MAADPDGEQWGVVVRSRGIPMCVSLTGTGPEGRWSEDDGRLVAKVRTALKSRPGTDAVELKISLGKLRAQRLTPHARALGTSADGRPRARNLIVLPSFAMAGIPVEALFEPEDTMTVSYAPSATIFKYLREQPVLTAMRACWRWATRYSDGPASHATPSGCRITACC